MTEKRSNQFSKLRVRRNTVAWPYRLRLLDAWSMTVWQRQFMETFRFNRTAERMERRLPPGSRLIRETWNEETKTWETIPRG